jgi:hypothetical protein
MLEAIITKRWSSIKARATVSALQTMTAVEEMGRDYSPPGDREATLATVASTPRALTDITPFPSRLSQGKRSAVTST